MGAKELLISSQRIRNATNKVSVYQFLAYRDYLNALYEYIKSEEEHYSYNQFAEDLGFSKSNVLWLVTTGKRRLTDLTATRLLEHLCLTRHEQRYYRLLMNHNNTRDAKTRDELLAEILALKVEHAGSEEVKENLEYFSEWYYPVIREMTSMDEFDADPKWIADHIYRRLLPKEITKSLKLLEDLNLIRYDKKEKRYRSTSKPITPDREVGTHAAIRFHQKMSELAAQSLNDTPEEEREYNTLTIAASEQEVAEIKNLIYDLCMKIVQVERKARKKDRVFQINLQLFPLSSPLKAGKKS